jgi:hypothetical protein
MQHLPLLPLVPHILPHTLPYNPIFGRHPTYLTYPPDDPGKFLVAVKDKTTNDIVNLHPLKIHKTFGKFLGPEDFVKKSGPSKLMFLLSTGEKANAFVKAVNSSKSTYLAVAYIPPSYVTVTGVIHDIDVSFSSEELFKNLRFKSPNITITSVRRYKCRTTGDLLPTVAVSFYTKVLPNDVLFHNLLFRVSPHSSLIFQSTSCWKFKHVDSSCRSHKICVICGKRSSVHPEGQCLLKDTKWCFLCGKRDHIASENRKCPILRELINDKRNNPTPLLFSRHGLLTQDTFPDSSFNSNTPSRYQSRQLT